MDKGNYSFSEFNGRNNTDTTQMTNLRPQARQRGKSEQSPLIKGGKKMRNL